MQVMGLMGRASVVWAEEFDSRCKVGCTVQIEHMTFVF